MNPRRPLRLASFDGGGPRGYSQLVVMAEIMQRLRCDKNPDENQKDHLPCDHFDLIGGSDTGGLIVIMFVTLRMSVEEAMEEFAFIVREVYKDTLPPAERTSKLKGCMESLLQKKDFPIKLKLQDTPQDDRCMGFVVATIRWNVRNQVRLRTYPVKYDFPSDITVVDAALATCASQPEFLPLSFGAWYDVQEYIGTGLGASNPVRQVITEARSYFRGEREVSLLLSLGIGHPGIIALDDKGKSLRRLMHDMMRNAEQEAQDIQHQMVPPRYFRFSVEQGLQKNESRAKGIEWIHTQTSAYLHRPDVTNTVDACVASMISPI